MLCCQRNVCLHQVFSIRSQTYVRVTLTVNAKLSLLYLADSFTPQNKLKNNVQKTRSTDEHWRRHTFNRPNQQFLYFKTFFSLIEGCRRVTLAHMSPCSGSQRVQDREGRCEWTSCSAELQRHLASGLRNTARQTRRSRAVTVNSVSQMAAFHVRHSLFIIISNVFFRGYLNRKGRKKESR